MAREACSAQNNIIRHNDDQAYQIIMNRGSSISGNISIVSIRSTGSISRIESMAKNDCGHCVHMIASVTYVYIHIHIRHWIVSVLDSDDVSIA